MGTVHSVRLGPEEERIVERTRRRLRLRTRSDAIKHLIREAGMADADEALERFFSLRAPPEMQLKGRSITSEEIDEVVYGDHIWPGTDS